MDTFSKKRGADGQNIVMLPRNRKHKYRTSSDNVREREVMPVALGMHVFVFPVTCCRCLQ